MSRVRRFLLAALATTAVLFSAGPALGTLGHLSRLEVADPREGHSALDVSEVDARAGAKDLLFTVVTWRRWRTSPMRDRGYLLIHLDPRSGRRYYALLRSGGRAMSAVLFRKHGRRDRRAGELRVWRNDRRSVSVRVPRRRIGLPAPGGQYSWRVQTLNTQERCKRVCFDHAPDAADALDTAPPATPTP